MSTNYDPSSFHGKPDFSQRPSSRRRFILGLGASAMAMGLAGYRLGSGSTITDKAATPSPNGALSGLKFARRTAMALGTHVAFIALHQDQEVAERALDDAFAELARVERVMSLYDPKSEISRLNATSSLKNPDPYLVRIIEESISMSEASNGAFDITVQPLWDLYAETQKEGHLPSPESIAETVERVDWRGISYSDKEIRLRDNTMAITLNGIAQGFAADRAMEALKRHGIQHALVDAGEISSLGHKASGSPWTVGIQHPRKKDAYLGLASLEGRCLSTSGDYETFFSPDFRYNHIFDPATGVSPLSFSSVTVVCPNATLADAMSTAIFVLGPERGLALATSYPGTDVLVVMKNQSMLATPGFPWSSNTADKPQSLAI